MTPLALKKTITRLSFIREQIAIFKEEEKDLTEKVCDLGKGDYEGANGEIVKVIEIPEGKPSYKLDILDLEKAKAIAGEEFASLFDKKTVFLPCKSFGDVVVKLLPKGVASKLLALVEKPGKPANAYLKWP